jgi:hypothetical protein
MKKQIERAKLWFGFAEYAKSNWDSLNVAQSREMSPVSFFSKVCMDLFGIYIEWVGSSRKSWNFPCYTSF